MENTSYIALSSLTAMMRQMDVVANNIANASTPAYNAERMLFEEYLIDIGQDEMASFVLDYAVVRDTSPGPIITTGNPLDVAINGKGYFVIETDEGLRYTRNGHFKLNAERTLVTTSGHPVLAAGGRTIQLGPNDNIVNVSAKGIVSGESGDLGRLDIVTFEDEQELRKAGDSLYTTKAAPRPAPKASVTQGMIENSNVNPIIEMTQMMRLSRRYQSTQNMLEQIDTLRRNAIERLGGQG